MQCGLAAPEIIVIHGGQIIMHQRVGVQELNGFPGSISGGERLAGDQLGAEGGEAASKLLPGAFSKVSERFAKPRVGTVSQAKVPSGSGLFRRIVLLQ